MLKIQESLSELQDFLYNIQEWRTEYKNKVRPLHPDYGNGDENNSYETYDEEYNIHLEKLHGLVDGYLEDEASVEPFKPASDIYPPFPGAMYPPK